MIHFQPRLEATQAALLYLGEPVFAAAYAWMAAGHALGAMTVAGGVLILAANAVVEVLGQERNAAAAEEAVGAEGKA